MDLSFSNDWAPLLNATFQGYVNLGGTQFKNIDVSRDLCEMHLHRYSGMVAVKYLEATYMIAACCVQVVELDPQITSAEVLVPAQPLPDEDELMKMAADSVSEEDLAKKTAEASTTKADTDRILAELGHAAPNLVSSGAARRQKRAKRGE